MSSPREALTQLLTEHAWYVAEKRGWCLGCLDETRESLRQFANVAEFAAHLNELITAEFLVVPRSDITEPLGYVVLAKQPERRLPHTHEYRTAGAIWSELATAKQQLAACQERALMDPQWYRGVEHLIGEVRPWSPLPEEVPDAG